MWARVVSLIAVIAAGAGCNQVFGLSPPTGGDPVDGAVEDAASDAPTDAPADGACPGDIDCDGVGDLNDNCPTVPNPKNRDFDGDGVGDLCDRCPTIEDATAATNRDGDGVDDACDISDALECVVWFDAFTDVPVVPPYHTTSLNVWMVADGTLTQTSPSLADEVLWTDAFYRDPTVATGGRVLFAQPLGDVPAPDYYAVEVAPVAANASGDLAGGVVGYLHANPSAATSILGLAPAGEVGATAALTMSLAGDNTPFELAASATRVVGGVNRSTSDVEGSPARAGGPLPVALRTRYVSAQFDYVLITDVDPVNCPTAQSCHCPPPPEP